MPGQSATCYHLYLISYIWYIDVSYSDVAQTALMGLQVDVACARPPACMQPCLEFNCSNTTAWLKSHPPRLASGHQFYQSTSLSSAQLATRGSAAEGLNPTTWYACAAAAKGTPTTTSAWRPTTAP